ncbi:MAG TPA: GLPGLI family protein [Puia sp.]|jgi:GLPGLI family protein
MQKFVFAAAILFSTLPAPPAARAQTTTTTSAAPAVLKEGRIIYQRKAHMWAHITDESMKAMIPEYTTSKAELDFSSDESIYKNVKEEQDIRDNAGQDGGNRIITRFGGSGSDDQTYRNYATEQATEQHELGPKKYLVVDSLQRQSWKLEPDTKTIMGYTCKKATTKGRNNADVIAWYAEDIQASAGPESFGGLPGLILELNINNDEMVYTPLEIITKDFNRKMVAAPTTGKKITRAEFRKMLEEMGMGAPGGKIMIHISRD